MERGEAQRTLIVIAKNVPMIDVGKVGFIHLYAASDTPVSMCSSNPIVI